jgi:predicted nucleic acid-binding protein
MSQVVDTSLLLERQVGDTTIFCVIEYPRSVKFVENIIHPNGKDFAKSIEIATKLLKIGKPVGAIDILNSAICINRNLNFITRDRDYENIKIVEPEFKLKLMK